MELGLCIEMALAKRPFEERLRAAAALGFHNVEMWFVDENTVVINGGSSRYTPRDVPELADVALAMKACGFTVGHMGWNAGTNAYARFVRGEPIWV